MGGLYVDMPQCIDALVRECAAGTKRGGGQGQGKGNGKEKSGDVEDDDDADAEDAGGCMLECFLSKLSPADLRIFLANMAREHPTTLAPLMINSLTPVAAEVGAIQAESS
jgi:hypothetical protein